MIDPIKVEALARACDLMKSRANDKPLLELAAEIEAYLRGEPSAERPDAQASLDRAVTVLREADAA